MVAAREMANRPMRVMKSLYGAVSSPVQKLGTSSDAVAMARKLPNGQAGKYSVAVSGTNVDLRSNLDRVK